MADAVLSERSGRGNRTTRTRPYRDAGRDVAPERDHPVGRELPSNFELAGAGGRELVGEDPRREAIVLSNGVTAGAIDDGVYRFRSSGNQVNVRRRLERSASG